MKHQQVEPTTSGCVEKHGSYELNVIWRRPQGIQKWTDAPQPKMQLFMKLITIKFGEEIANAYTKFKGC